ncbi:PQQ-binding-like beta-propeller repeat protein [Streptomyces sp. NPDC057302]|uniref:outer membrane protein assembly factor BamB family protein n=1 Tax=Streptomyces sp. NPDC057302 TaxID=3346094 RepID=UPI0036268A5F
MVNREPEQPVHRPVPGNPYAQPPPSTGTERRLGVALAAGALALALIGVGVYAVTQGDADGGGNGSREPVAGQTRQSPDGGRESAGSDRDGDAKDDGQAAVIDVNAGRKPGEAKAWLAMNDIELPGKGAQLLDLWHVPGIVAQAEYDEVTGYRTDDGSKAWSVPVPGTVCDTPVNPTPDGKVVVVYTKRKSERNTECDQLRMIDLKTGKKGWHKELVDHGFWDDTSMTHVSITGSTVMVDQSATMRAYRIGDGKRLFTTERERKGGCSLDGVAGGSRLLQVESCAPGSPGTHGRLKRLDPRTGDVKWNYRTKKGWNIRKVYSVDPAVVAVQNREEMEKWAVVAVDDKGRQRSWISADKGPHAFEMCAGAGDSGEGVQNCPGAAVVADTFYLASEPKDGVLGPNKIVAFDLRTGKPKWTGAVEGGRQITPVAVAPGSSGADRPGVIAYARAQDGKSGQTVRFGRGGGKPDVLLRHTSSAQEMEAAMFAGNTLYADGRFFVTPTRLDGKAHGGKGEEGNARMLAFAR